MRATGELGLQLFDPPLCSGLVDRLVGPHAGDLVDPLLAQPVVDRRVGHTECPGELLTRVPALASSTT
jgi:hypothetical protein